MWVLAWLINSPIFSIHLYKMAILNAMASLQTGSYAVVGKHEKYKTHDLYYICMHVVEVINCQDACRQIVFKDDTIYSETYTVKKVVCLHFWPKFRILRNKTKNLALNQFKINRANIQDLLLIIDLHASLASLHSKIKKGKIRRIFANTDYGRNV